MFGLSRNFLKRKYYVLPLMFFEWKTIGPVKKSRSEAMWQRFRAACDSLLRALRAAPRHRARRTRRGARGDRPELERSPAGCNPRPRSVRRRQRIRSDAVRALRARWQQEIAARGVDRDRAVALDERFAAAFARGARRARRRSPAPISIPTRTASGWKRSCADGGARRLARRRRRCGATPALSPTTRLAAMLKEALAANTIGGKVDDDSRFRAAADDVRQAQASWSRIGPVPDEVRRALADRFPRACRRITEKTGVAGMAGGVEGRSGRKGRSGGRKGVTRRSRPSCHQPPAV